MIQTPHIDWFALSPELTLLGTTALCLFAAVLVPRWGRRGVTAFLCGGGYIGAFVAAALLYAKSPHAQLVVADALRRDRWGALAQLIVAGAGLLTVLISWSERMSNDHVAEYFALLAACGAGMCLFVQANNLMVVFLGLEWFSICLYVLCAIDVQLEGSLEAGLKYLIIGSFGSAFLLFGSALVYGATGQISFERIAAAVDAQGLSHDSLLLLGLAMLLTGLMFKASAAPFHMWTPDVYEGAPTAVTAFMAAATKVAALTVTYRILTTAFPQEARLWTWAVAAIACASLAIGNLAALVQRSLKRLLAYSSVSHAGFMLIPIAANNALGARALMYYLIPYAALSLGAFGVVAARERELGVPVTLDNLSGFGWERPLLGASMWIFMLGFAGMPLTGGLIGKFYAFSAAYDRGWTWLVIVGVAATAVSLYYYLGVIRAMYMRPREPALSESPMPAPRPREVVVSGGSPPPERVLSTAVFLCVGVAVGSFIFVQPLIDLARHAADSLPL